MGAACGLVWPGEPWPGLSWPSGTAGACLGTDYSALDDCKGCWIRYTDDNLASSVTDHCDGGGQSWQNDIYWGVDVAADAGDAPDGSPAGSDSTYHDGVDSDCAGGIAAQFQFDPFSTGTWVKKEKTDSSILIRRGSGLAEEGHWKLVARIGDYLRGHMSGTNQHATAGPSLPQDEWVFVGMDYDDEIRTFSSQSAAAGTLLDCDGTGSDTCASDIVGPGPAESVGFAGNAGGGVLLKGSLYENWFCAVKFTEAQWCEICRCGFYGDNASDRKAVCNHCSMTEAARGLGPAEPWP